MGKFRVLIEDDLKPLLAWWHWLDDNRGDRAQLRRAGSAEDILLTPAFAHFLQQMPERWAEFRPITDVAMVAAVLARVKNHDGKHSFAKSLALPKMGGGRAVMSALRFQQLQKSDAQQDFFRRICRAVALLGGAVNIFSLADGILHWQLEHRTCIDREPLNRLAVRWATDYYAALKD